MDTHKQAVASISSRVSSFYEKKTRFRLYHGSTNTTQTRKIDPNKVIDTSKLNHVFNIDTEKMTCLAEPNVAMDELFDAVLPYGLLPPVVMEFPGITVGGGFAGTAGESSGFKYGFFDCIINWIEMVLPNGEIVTASPTEREDLFHGAAGSFGTLGVATLFEIRLIKAKRYVEMTYHPVTSVAEALTTMDEVVKDETNDYVDGIQFSTIKGVIVTGRLTDELPTGFKLQHFSRAQDPWFYIHIDQTTGQSFEETKEFTPVRDYLFRYDRGAFWTGKYAYEYFLTPFNWVTRWALDYFMHTRVMYHALHVSGHASKYIVQDLLLPRSGVEDFVTFVDQKFGFWPLWLCPLKRGEKVPLHPDLAPELDDKAVSFVNVGVWGPGSTTYSNFISQNRALEQKVRQLGGVKWLYAQAFYTEDEFWDIYDRKRYDALREKYHASYLPNVWEKVRVDLSKASGRFDTRHWNGWVKSLVWRVWPVSGVYGVVKTLLERDYLLDLKRHAA